MAELSYSYIDKDDKSQSITITDSSLIEQINQAKNDFDISKRIIHAKLIHIWNWSLRAYHMGMEDRRIRAQLKDWQSNIPFWLIRSFCDVFISTLTEKPITINARGITQQWADNAEYIQRSLATSADATWYQSEARIIMNEGIKIGMFSAEVGILWPVKPRTYTSITVDENGKENIVEHEFTDEIGNFPYARYVPVFELYPDPANSDPRYIARRHVINHKSFIRTYGDLIASDDNKSPLKDMIHTLPLNENGADKDNYNVARDQVHRAKNIEFAKTDSIMFDMTGNPVNFDEWLQSADQDSKKQLIEVIYHTTDDEIVLFANNYPVYIWPNPFGFIPFEMLSASDPQYILDCEGVPYKLAGLSDTMDSFMNNYIDSARSIATPNFIALKWAFLDMKSLEWAAPWTIHFAETEAGANSLRRLDKGSVTDFNILDIVIKIASQITGISEYNLGISARERTATGALATTQSSLKRLSPFLVAFNKFQTRISQKQLRLMRDYWTDKVYIAAAGVDKPPVMISNINLGWAVDISLQMDSMQSAIDEFGYKKLLEIFNQMQWRWLVNENELTKALVKSLGLSPDRFVPPTAPAVTTPPDTIPELDTWNFTPEQLMGQDLTAAATPQIDLGNEWQGNQ